MNNDERRLWVENDEGLYNWRKAEHLSINAFIQKYKSEIDEAIKRALA